MAERDEPAAAGGGGGKEAELKKELESVVNKMIEEDDFRIEKTVQAIRILTRLGESKLKIPGGLGIDDPVLSESFKCPLSGKIMNDPVILASGQTYDRPYIENWLNQGNLTCFKTKQVLSHSFVTPNCLVRELIGRWCGVSGVAVPEPPMDARGLITTRDRLLLNSLLDKMSSSISDQKEAAKELRRLTQALESHRVALCGLPGAVSRLLRPLSQSSIAEFHPDLLEDLIATVLNISTHENNKKVVGENPMVVPHLTLSLKFGTLETRKNAAAALSTLSELDSNKLIIGKSLAPMALLRLLDGGHPLAIKEAASAIFNLCAVDENKTIFVTIGTVNAIKRKINDSLFVDELLRILVLLSKHPTALYQLRDANTVQCLMRILRQSNSSPTKENCVVILFAVCTGNLDLLKVLWIEEEQNKSLAELAATGLGRAKRKARGLIRKITNAFPSLPSTS